MTNNISKPKLSIITPSYNQGKYIEQTIQSVLALGIDNIEYIIIDGGSTDDTVSIIEKYQDSIAYWVSEKDNGQSHAINKGFAIATGDIVAWINSDDVYMFDILPCILNNLNISNAEICFGNCIHFQQERFSIKSWGSDVISQSKHSLDNHDYIIQPSSFWTRKALELIGPLREDLHYAFDWEWFLRAKVLGVSFRGVADCLSMYRIHDEHKSGTGGFKRRVEILSIYNEYSPKYGKLYSLLIAENFNCNTLYRRIIKKILYIMGKPHSDISVVLFLNKGKYRDYSLNEINNCLLML